jgi:NTE family protein
MPNNGKPSRVALVIGSGGIKCAAALGVLNVLEREGIELDMVVGCSGGSIYAIPIAMGYDSQTVAEMSYKLWTSEITGRRKLSSWLKILMPGIFGFNEEFGLVDDKLVMERLQAGFGDRTFADTKIPLYVVATDFLNGDQVVMTEGRLVDAARASIAIPYIFAPHRVGDHVLVDGYLSDPLPVGVAMREGADIIVAVGFDSPYQYRINSLMRYSFQVSTIMANNLLKSNYAFHNLAHHTEVIPIMPQFKERIKLFDTSKTPYIIEEGEKAAEEQLPYLRRLLAQTEVESL